MSLRRKSGGIFEDDTKPLNAGVATMNAQGTRPRPRRMTTTGHERQDGLTSADVTIGTCLHASVFTHAARHCATGTHDSGPADSCIQDGVLGNTITASKAVHHDRESGQLRRRRQVMAGTARSRERYGVASFGNLTIDKTGTGTRSPRRPTASGKRRGTIRHHGPTGTIAGRVTGGHDGAAVVGAAVEGSPVERGQGARPSRALTAPISVTVSPQAHTTSVSRPWAIGPKRRMASLSHLFFLSLSTSSNSLPPFLPT
jgi:hypothetical protein